MRQLTASSFLPHKLKLLDSQFFSQALALFSATSNHFQPSPDSHFRVCRHVGSRNPRPWESLIGRFSATGNPHKSLLVYAAMHRHGVAPSHHTFPPIFKAFSKLKTLDPRGFHAHALKFGLDFDTYVRNSLISAYANCGYVDCARCVFGESAYKDLVSFTAMIDGFVRNGFAVRGLKCFLEMRSKEMIGDEVTVVSVLMAAAIMGDAWFGKSIHGFYVETGRVRRDVYVECALVDMYAKCGSLDDARKLFDGLQERNVVCWSAMISGYVQCERFKEALVVFQDMLVKDVKPNQQTLTSALTACAQLGTPQQGRWIESYINRNFVKINCTAGTALVDMYSKSGCIDEAFRVFNNLPEKNVYTWTAMISGLALHGDASGSLNLFTQMLTFGVTPNEVTFIGALAACSHGGLIDEGRKLFRSMREEYHLEPNVDHYGCMVDLLGRAGCLEETKTLIESMPLEPTSGILGALFSACVLHNAFELGEDLGKRLLELEPYHSGTYALLANLYAAHGKWEKATYIRKLMNEKCVRKAPGLSWIDLSGKIHEFVSLEGSHCESSSLYVMLNNVSLEMKFNGYAQEMTFVGIQFKAD